MPIIIFSSTGRREVSEILNHYENIITDFEKPRFFGTAEPDIAQQTEIKFCTAMEKALKITAGRKVLNYFTNYQQINMPLGASKENGRYSIALYLDESEVIKRSKFIVGGTLAIYPPGLMPEHQTDGKKSWKMWREKFSKELLESKRSFRIDRKNIEEKILQLAQEENIFLACVAVTSILNKANPTLSPLQNETLIDNQYRELFRLVVESAVFGLARSKIPPGAKANIYIIAGTRIVPLKNFLNNSNEDNNDAKDGTEDLNEELDKIVTDLRKYWGIKTEYKNYDSQHSCPDCWNAEYYLNKIIRTNNADEIIKGYAKNLMEEIKFSKQKPEQGILFIGYDSIRPLVDETMRHYHLDNLSVKTACAYDLTSDKKNAFFLHLFADSAITSFDSKDSKFWRANSNIWQNGFVINKTKFTEYFIQTQRYLLRDLIVEALLCAATAIQQEYVDKYEQTLLSELSYQAQKLTGHEIINFCLNYKKQLITEEIRGEIVKIIHQDNRFLIKDHRGCVWDVNNDASAKLRVKDEVTLKEIELIDGLHIDPMKAFKVKAIVNFKNK